MPRKPTNAPARPVSSRAAARHSGKPPAGKSLSYANAGVNLEEKDQFTESLTSLMRRTHGPRVIQNPGGFAGLFRLDFNERLFAKNYKDPVLVACTDGCGTKVKLAASMKKFDTIGIDLVAMNVNDMIVQGAEPLFFLDYVAVGKVDKSMLTDVLKGVAEGCKQSGCALLGGETAEMPGVYQGDDFDLAGFAVGVVELARAIDPLRVEPGDIVLGLESDGVHSNGYSLVRSVVEHAKLDLNKVYPALTPPPSGKGQGGGRASNGSRTSKKKSAAAPSRTLGEVLLTPTRIYVKPIVKLLHAYRVKKVVSGMAHITGSGLVGNLERALHPKVDAIIDTKSWPMPPLFKFLMDQGNITEVEMRRVFNMGIGFTLVVRPSFAESVAEQLTKMGERVHTIGKIVKGKGQVREE